MIPLRLGLWEFQVYNFRGYTTIIFHSRNPTLIHYSYIVSSHPNHGNNLFVFFRSRRKERKREKTGKGEREKGKRYTPILSFCRYKFNPSPVSGLYSRHVSNQNLKSRRSWHSFFNNKFGTSYIIRQYRRTWLFPSPNILIYILDVDISKIFFCFNRNLTVSVSKKISCFFSWLVYLTIWSGVVWILLGKKFSVKILLFNYSVSYFLIDIVYVLFLKYLTYLLLRMLLGYFHNFLNLCVKCFLLYTYRLFVSFLQSS